MNTNDPEKSHFEDIEDNWKKTCKHPGHKPPGHMVIPQGKRYVHICPACGTKVILTAPQISFSTSAPRTITEVKEDISNEPVGGAPRSITLQGPFQV